MGTTANISAILQAEGVTTTKYRNAIPVNVHTAIGIFNDSGLSPQHTMGAIAFRQPSFQVIARSPTMDAAEVLIVSVRNVLDGYSDSTYVSIRQKGDIINIGKNTDETYHQFSLNFEAREV